MNFVDPDGRRWVNKQKQIVCDANGPTVYATPEEVELIKAMNSIRTGRQQLQKLVEAPFDVGVVINAHEKPRRYGKVTSKGIQYDENEGRYIAKGGSVIIIYKQQAMARAENQKISVNEAIAVNLGHEIEHITSEGLLLSIKYRGDDSSEAMSMKEAKPNQISNMMILEFVNKLSRDKINELQQLVNSMVQNSSGIIPNINLDKK